MGDHQWIYCIYVRKKKQWTNVKNGKKLQRIPQQITKELHLQAVSGIGSGSQWGKAFVGKWCASEAQTQRNWERSKKKSIQNAAHTFEKSTENGAYRFVHVHCHSFFVLTLHSRLQGNSARIFRYHSDWVRAMWWWFFDGSAYIHKYMFESNAIQTKWTNKQAIEPFVGHFVRPVKVHSISIL